MRSHFNHELNVDIWPHVIVHACNPRTQDDKVEQS
jgi:hypothetical protein